MARWIKRSDAYYRRRSPPGSFFDHYLPKVNRPERSVSLFLTEKRPSRGSGATTTPRVFRTCNLNSQAGLCATGRCLGGSSLIHSGVSDRPFADPNRSGCRCRFPRIECASEFASRQRVFFGLRRASRQTVRSKELFIHDESRGISKQVFPSPSHECHADYGRRMLHNRNVGNQLQR